MNRFLKLAFVYITVAILAVAMLGCQTRSITLQTDIASQLSAISTYFQENVYAKTAGTDFNTDTSPNYVADQNYYVKVATNAADSGDKLKLGNTIYDKGEESVFNVGSSNTISRMPFKVDGEDLYVAFWLLVLNADENGEVNASLLESNIIDFKITIYAQSENNLTATIINVGSADLISAGTRVYKFESADNTNAVFVELYNIGTNLSSSNQVIVEKVLNPGLESQDFMYEFLNPTLPSGQTKNGLLLCPGYNNNQQYTPGNPADFVVEYKFYVVGVGSYNFTLQVKNTATA